MANEKNQLITVPPPLLLAQLVSFENKLIGKYYSAAASDPKSADRQETESADHKVTNCHHTLK
jgi:hypothetical protein